MCLIIDACVRDAFFAAEPCDACEEVHKWLKRGGAFAVGGTKYMEECFQGERRMRILISHWERGTARVFPHALVDEEQTAIESSCTSNDSHIIALARISGARVLYSYDRASGLHADFKNTDLVSKPQGKIYKTESHKALLEHTKSCATASKRKLSNRHLFRT